MDKDKFDQFESMLEQLSGVAPKGTIRINPDVYNLILTNAEKQLISQPVSKKDIDPSIINDQSKSLPEDIPSKSGVYAIWVDGVVQYVGEAKNIRSRLRQHLIYKSAKTGSKLAEVTAESSKGKNISVSYILVEPAQFRFAVEQGLIGNLTDNGSALPWNTHGTKPNTVEKWILDCIDAGVTSEEMIAVKAIYELGMPNSLDQSLKALEDADKIRPEVNNGMIYYKRL